MHTFIQEHFLAKDNYLEVIAILKSIQNVDAGITTSFKIQPTDSNSSQ